MRNNRNPRTYFSQKSPCHKFYQSLQMLSHFLVDMRARKMFSDTNFFYVSAWWYGTSLCNFLNLFCCLSENVQFNILFYFSLLPHYILVFHSFLSLSQLLLHSICLMLWAVFHSHGNNYIRANCFWILMSGSIPSPASLTPNSNYLLNNNTMEAPWELYI